MIDELGGVFVDEALKLADKTTQVQSADAVSYLSYFSCCAKTVSRQLQAIANERKSGEHLARR